MAEGPLYNPNPTPDTGSRDMEQHVSEELQRVSEFSVDVARNKALLKEIEFRGAW